MLVILGNCMKWKIQAQRSDITGSFRVLVAMEIHSELTVRSAQSLPLL